MYVLKQEVRGLKMIIDSYECWGDYHGSVKWGKYTVDYTVECTCTCYKTDSNTTGFDDFTAEEVKSYTVYDEQRNEIKTTIPEGVMLFDAEDNADYSDVKWSSESW